MVINLKHKYGLIIHRYYIKSKNINLKITKYMLHILFLSNCLAYGLVPNGLQFHNHTQYASTTRILNRCSQLVIMNLRKEHKRKIKILRQELHRNNIKLFTNINHEDQKLVIDQFNQYIAISKRDISNKHMKKLHNLKLKYGIKESINSNNIVNISNTELTDNESSLLNKGLNYTLNNVTPTNEIISNIESNLIKLEVNKANEIRSKIATALKNHKNDATSHEKSIVQSLKKKKNILITKSDKGGKTVIIDKSKYDSLMENIVNEKSMYNVLVTDPLLSLTKKLKKLINSLRLDTPIKKYLLPDAIKTSTIYGLPKIHKPTLTLRPIINTKGSISYNLSKFLNNLLKPLIDKTKLIKNSFDIVSKLKDMQFNGSYKLVSFDIINLFHNIPLEETKDIIKTLINKLQIDFDGLTTENILSLIDFIVESNYFKYKDKFYFQKFGTPMGSPISPILSEIFLQDLENRILTSSNIKPSIWIRYVDDIFLIWKDSSQELNDFLKFCNEFHNSIKFTMELEVNDTLQFMDIGISKNGPNLEFKQQYKKIHTDSYLHKTSNHPLIYKENVIKNMYFRMLKLTDVQYHDQKTNELINLFQNSGYSKQFCLKVIDKFKRNRPRNCNNNRYNNVITIPYVQGLSEKLETILKSYKIRCVFKPPINLAKLLNNNKDVLDISNAVGVYKINCNSCGKIYIGETGRSINTRIKEHQYAIKAHNTNNALFMHTTECQATFDWNSISLLHCEERLWKRKIKESIQIFINRNSIINLNSGIDLNAIWKPLLK